MNTLKDEKEKHDTLCEWTNTKKQNISSHRRKDDDTKMNTDWVSRAKERSYKQANEGWTDGQRNRGSVHKDEQIVVGGGKINLSWKYIGSSFIQKGNRIKLALGT